MSFSRPRAKSPDGTRSASRPRHDEPHRLLRHEPHNGTSSVDARGRSASRSIDRLQTRTSDPRDRVRAWRAGCDRPAFRRWFPGSGRSHRAPAWSMAMAGEATACERQPTIADRSVGARGTHVRCCCPRRRVAVRMSAIRNSGASPCGSRRRRAARPRITSRARSPGWRPRTTRRASRWAGGVGTIRPASQTRHVQLIAFLQRTLCEHMRPPATRRRFPYGYRSAVDGRACLAVQRAVCPDLVYPPTPLAVTLDSTAAQAHRTPCPERHAASPHSRW